MVFKAPDPSGDGVEIDWIDDSLKGGFHRMNTGSVNVNVRSEKAFCPIINASQEFSDRDQFIDNIDSVPKKSTDEAPLNSLANCTGDTKFEAPFLRSKPLANVIVNVNDIDQQLAPLSSGLRCVRENDRCRSDCEQQFQRVITDRQRRQIRCRYSQRSKAGDGLPL